MFSGKEKRTCMIGGILFVITLVMDRLSKAWAKRVLLGEFGGKFPGIEGLFHFRYAENTGAAFSMLSGMQWLNCLLTAVLLIAAAVFIWKHRRTPSMVFAGSLLLSGGVSHLYDRVFGGVIVDFIDLDFMRFAVFNIADICVCTGAVLLMLFYLLETNDKQKGER